jgi:hypothetical protein
MTFKDWCLDSSFVHEDTDPKFSDFSEFESTTLLLKYIFEI